MGHEDAALTLQVYAQVIQRQRLDYDLVWKLMRFNDEEETWPGPRRSSFGQRDGHTEPRNDRDTMRGSAQ